jgi:hypothetical protein
MLKGTASAAGIKGTEGFNPQGRRLEYFLKLRPYPASFFFADAQARQIARSGQFCKNALPFVPGKACAACGYGLHSGCYYFTPRHLTLPF